MTTVTNLLRDVTCALGAGLVTLVLSLAFVESTSAAPFQTPAAQSQTQTPA
jgi:hypothetical protein